MKRKWIWFVLLILSFTFGVAFTAFANEYLDTPAHEILSDGKILHKEVHYQKHSELFHDKYDFIYANQIVAVDYVVIHRKEFYNCSMGSQATPILNIPDLTSITCRLMKEYPTVNIRKD